MPDDRHPADQAVTLPKKQQKSVCILDEFFVGKISDAQHPSGGRVNDHELASSVEWDPVRWFR